MEQKLGAADLDKDFPVTNFKLGVKEMVGKGARRKSFSTGFRTKKSAIWPRCRYGSTRKRGLPLKRMMAGKDKKTIGELTETYSVFTSRQQAGRQAV